MTSHPEHAELDVNGSTRADWPAWAAGKTQLLLTHRVWSNPVFLLLLAAALLGVCTIRAYIGISYMRIYTQDAFVYLDGGWRLLNGQIPFRDFYSDLGPFIHLMTALSLKWSHGGVQALGYAQAVIAGALGIWAFGLGASRLTPLTRVLLCLTVVLLAISPYTLGENIVRTGPDCTYNRYGYVLIGLAMIEAVCPREQGRGSEFLGGFSTGAMAGLVPFIKISYLFGIGFLLLLLLPCRTQTLRRWAGIVAGFAVVIAGFLVLMGGSFVPMFNDSRMLAGAKHLEWRWYLAEALMQGIAPMLILVFLAVVLLRNAGASTLARSIGLAGLATAILGPFFILTNFQRYSLPLNAFLSIIILSFLTSLNGPAYKLRALIRGAACWYSGLLVLSLFILETGALMYGFAQRIRPTPSVYRSFDSPRLEGFYSSEEEYVDLVNDGLRLVAKFRRQNDTVMSLDFCNPFSFSLGMKPASGGATSLKYQTNFDYTHRPSAERLIGKASLLAIPKVFTNSGLTDTVPRLYGPYIKDHFQLIGESMFWRLYRQ